MADNALTDKTGDLARHSVARSSWAMVAGYSVMLIFLVLCGNYVYSHIQEFAFIATVSLPDLGVAGLLILLNFGVGALQLDLFLRHYGVCLRYTELMALTGSMCLGNLVIPMRGGTGAMALYLKRVHEFNFGAFGVVYAGTALLTVLVNTAYALVGFMVLYVRYGMLQPALSILVACLFALCCYLTVFPPLLIAKDRGWLRPIFEAANSWHFLTRRRPLLLRLTLLLALTPLSLTGAFYFIYQGLGKALSVDAVLITSTLGNLANLVPVVPGSLGVFDTITIAIPQLFGLDGPRAVCATLTYRVLFFFWALLWGIPGGLYLLSSLRSRKLQSDSHPKE
ncbi:MAG: flippase-like domain-containing protein [Desulfomonile tiedjei]|uniref:Flippase-like domain-containing protein n=1 Tax=Desulfomonile tiedjei TaxID=2358 RepID=A0A9D6V2I2_9BACT|nr:flippase-like domain-containing protein [Desulfomonile tiedjei]